MKMNYFRLFVASAGVGLFLANCTVRQSTSDECEKGDKDVGCECPGGVTGFQVCDSDGVFGSCQCPDDNNNTSGSGNNTSGSGNNGGTGNGGSGGTDTSPAGAAPGGAGSEAGAGGVGPVDIDPNNCEECLQQQCATEFQACLDDPICFSQSGNGSGQYERIIDCIDGERVDGLVKRDVVRGCGVTIGNSPDPDLISDWAPENMAATTTNLLNCLATGASDPKGPNADWANSDDNFPVDNQGNIVPTPWPEDSCAKISCTGKFQ